MTTDHPALDVDTAEELRAAHARRVAALWPSLTDVQRRRVVSILRGALDRSMEQAGGKAP